MASEDGGAASNSLTPEVLVANEDIGVGHEGFPEILRKMRGAR